MHHFQTTLGNETTVAAPKAGELLAGNAIDVWAPVPANVAKELKVLTQRLSETPQWQVLADIPQHDLVLQHEAIEDPKEPDFGMPCMVEMQLLMVQVLDILRAAKLIASE